MSSAFLYSGAILIFIWGVGHLMPTRNVVAGFGELSLDNARILTMEWLVEGLTLCFLGVLVALVTFMVGPAEPATLLVARTASGMLFVLAAVSVATGARTSLVPMKLCPLVKSIVAAVWLTATFM
jgi:hypothetical protein